MPAMISSEPDVATCVITGATLFTWGRLASTPPIFTGIGAPLNAPMKDDPGGRTRMSAPIPAVRARESCIMPRQSPTISRIMVTSSATATMLIRDRIGRWPRFPTIMRFIMSFPDFFWGLRSAPSRRGVLPFHLPQLLGLIVAGAGYAMSGIWHRRTRLRAQMYDLGSWRLLQSELIVAERPDQFQLEDPQG